MLYECHGGVKVNETQAPLSVLPFWILHDCGASGTGCTYKAGVMLFIVAYNKQTQQGNLTIL